MPSAGSENARSVAAGSNRSVITSVAPSVMAVRVAANRPTTWNIGASDMIVQAGPNSATNEKLSAPKKAPPRVTIAAFGRPVVPDV